MRRIPQEDDYGCLIASLAMVLDRPYHYVKAELHAALNAYPGRQGINEFDASEFMFKHGYALVRRYMFDCVAQKPRPEWPCKPFAPVHICYVNATKGPHACAMDSEGRVYDPFSADRLTLHHPDYKSIDHIDGFFLIPR